MAEGRVKNSKPKNKKKGGIIQLLKYLGVVAFLVIMAIWGRSTYLFRYEASKINVEMRSFNDLYLVALAAFGHLVRKF